MMLRSKVLPVARYLSNNVKLLSMKQGKLWSSPTHFTPSRCLHHETPCLQSATTFQRHATSTTNNDTPSVVSRNTDTVNTDIVNERLESDRSTRGRSLQEDGNETFRDSTSSTSSSTTQILQVDSTKVASKRSQGKRKTRDESTDTTVTSTGAQPSKTVRKPRAHNNVQSLRLENAALRLELATLRAKGGAVQESTTALNNLTATEAGVSSGANSMSVRTPRRAPGERDTFLHQDNKEASASIKKSSAHAASNGHEQNRTQENNTQPVQPSTYTSGENMVQVSSAKHSDTSTGMNAKSRKHKQAKMASRARKAEMMQKNNERDGKYLPARRSELSQLRHLFYKARESKSYRSAVEAAENELKSGKISSEDGLTAINIFKHAKKPDSCLEVLDALRKNGREMTAVHYTSTMASFNKPEHTAKALELLTEMEERNIAADVITYNSAISACEKAKQGDQASQILRRMVQANLTPNVKTYNGAISANGKARKTEEALALFAEMQEAQIAPNTITYNVAIAACGVSRKSAKAVELLLEMETKGLEPNVITYNAAIFACNAVKWHAKGIELLKEMQGKGIKADTVVYNTALWLCVHGSMPEVACDLLREMVRDGVRKDDSTAFAAKEACTGKNSTVDQLELARLLS
ncbi:hypothetical protein SARC_10620 [Sphaeroforma arctica JP610]|uniref:Pentacotripeptide-repeat region of PRORP domain-containing protein n=1 Tax=Sphaeroforma arctica JP610 TaxID=667725 RepID=A0A0L0FJD1_9EUKA|nr:hypothetical protein SARC_10620 [Sphaeroforma arctica JP610]KNC76904.1 hypothetical protein SARC_10620 [Sphaeroforma arctica JP610]|eukprot:XP_014150806.1 hypothetical protein SARC_10620 [Sphaeroforma arctica JP610]